MTPKQLLSIKTIANRLENDIHMAQKHRRINTGMIGVMLLMLATNFWRIQTVGLSVQKDFELSQTNASSINVVKQRQDIYRQQYLDYIKDMIDAMNKLQIDNPGLKVPKAPVPRPIAGDTSESDLRREPQPGPSISPHATPTPKIVTKVITKRIKPRHSPTPKPFFQWFKSTR